MIHGVLVSILTGLALVWWLARRKPKATHVVICGGEFADEFPAAARQRAYEHVVRAKDDINLTWTNTSGPPSTLADVTPKRKHRK